MVILTLVFRASSQIRGGLRNLENLILSLTLENQLLCKGFNPVEKQLIKIDSQLQGVFLGPREFGFWRPLSVRLSEVRGSNSTTPQGDGNISLSGVKNTATKFKFHYPARGRKQILANLRLTENANCSNSTTPEGDGNVSFTNS